NQSGGTVTFSSSTVAPVVGTSSAYNLIAGEFDIPSQSLSLQSGGAFNVSGTGSANLAGLSVTHIGSELAGSVNQTGGQVNVANGAEVDGIYTLSGGTLSSGGLGINGTFSYQGGTLRAGALSVFFGKLNMSSGGGKVARCTSLSITSSGSGTTSVGGLIDLN